MKLNFWQRLGLLMLAVGLAVVIYERKPKPGVNPNPPTPAIPSTLPATQPLP